jgi:hypothetical protein
MSLQASSSPIQFADFLIAASSEWENKREILDILISFR